MLALVRVPIRWRGRATWRAASGSGLGRRAGGWCGTPEMILRRIGNAARSASVRLLPTIVPPETVRLLAREVVAAL